MATTVKVEWKGDDLKKRMSAIVREAIDDTTAAAAIQAKKSHPSWRNVTGTAEASLQMRPAERQGSKWVGLFGSFDVIYFIWLEIGTRFRSGDFTVRRAADKEFPKLAQRIAAKTRALR